ncbi:TPA: histidine phosphatase family protein [Klebsiella oxytoca]|nr:histidine phosphatase family protein [Klebsiella oxytoca]HEC2095667.1 histidine phosphatase family protein [Klebsiella oxytoca]
MMQVILVRHAETEWNVREILQGQSDSALTSRGKRQTSALLAAFAACDYRVECVYASPLGRAWQMLLKHSPDAAEALFKLDAEYCPPGGESLSYASQRMMHFLYALGKKRHHQTICIVSHGHVIQGVLSILKSGTVDDFPRYAQPNASYSVFDLIDGRCAALRWGIATHLRLRD